MKRKSLLNIYSDASSLVLRALLREPERKWKAKELVREGASLGLVSEVLSKAEALGYVERAVKGRDSYTRLIRKEALVNDWLANYRFERSQHSYFFYPGKDFTADCGRFLKQKKTGYALTLFSASRLVSPFVKDNRHFIYLDVERRDFTAFLDKAADALGLLKLAHGGNVCFASPYYLCSLFKEIVYRKGVPAVSNLQLYLDLMTFPPSGPEEARHLIPYFRKEGARFV